MLGSVCNTNSSTVKDYLENLQSIVLEKQQRRRMYIIAFALTWHSFCFVSKKGNSPLNGGTATERSLQGLLETTTTKSI